MASLRIAWNPNTNNGSITSIANKLRNVIGQLQGGRQALGELKLILDKYNSDFTSMGTDLGAAVADATTIYNLIVQAYGELESTATTQVSVGQSTGCRQLVDSLG